MGAGKRDVKIEDQGAQELHPNLKMIGRDKAHAFRKVLQRPYAADDFLETVMNDHILGSHSMTQIIANSHEFSLWLEEEIGRQESTAGFGAKTSVQQNTGSSPIPHPWAGCFCIARHFWPLARELLRTDGTTKKDAALWGTFRV